MFCKKCGTEQREGQKFCPKCGEPFLDENGKPYLKGIKKDIQDAKQKMASKVDELTQQGKKLVEEKVQPQFDEKIEDLKKVNWDEKKKNTSSYVNEFIQNPSKIGLITKVLVCIFVVWFFAKRGFSVSFLWYAIVAAMIYIVFKGIPYVKIDILKKQYISTGLCIFLMIITVMCTSKNSENSGFFQSKTPQEEFLESMDKSSIAYVARIDMIVRPHPLGTARVEVPEGAGDKDNSYKWTLIFFPDAEAKISGRATLEAWLIDRKALADAFTRTYKYEIRDDRIELYNGYKKPSFSRGWTKVDDIRLYIEKGSEGVQLRGEFQNEQRIFMQTDYLDSEHRDQHRYVH